MNIIAVIVVGLIYFGIHMLWYFPFLFGKKWLELVGKESEPKEKIIRDTIIMIPTSIVTILILAIILDLANTTTILGAIIISIILWIGFVFTIGFNQSNFNDRTSILLFLIEYGFYLLGFLFAGIILVIWV
jgi:hypothetical protein